MFPARILSLTLALPVLTLGVGSVVVPVSGAAATGTTVPSTFAFTGGGWGHGVGMSQTGAYGMASEGASATTILKHYYTGTTVGAYKADQDIKVNLLHRVSSIKVRSEVLTAGGGSLTADLGATEVDGKASDNFGVQVWGKKLIVTKNGIAQGDPVQSATLRWAGTRHPSTTDRDDTKATLVNIVNGTASFTTSGHRYRYGTVTVVARAVDGVTRLEVVNSLRLQDEYLRGIGEVPSSWPKAALQAQVIAARSYALVKYAQGTKAGCQCHVDSGHGPYFDQNFVGYSKESSSYGSAWRAAVTATVSSSTTAQTVLYKGKPAQAFYSSSTGGRTQNVKDVWGSSIPYLVSVDDHWSTNPKYNPTFATWGPYQRTQKQVASAFGLANVKSVNISNRYVSGAVKAVTATSSTGKTATLTPGTFVTRLGLMSNWVRTVKTAGSVAVSGGTTAPAAKATYANFPLAKANGKVRYYGYKAAHKNLGARVLDGSGKSASSLAARKQIKKAQTWLIKLGYLNDAPDGGFGKHTNNAVRAFQKKHKMTVNGLVGGAPSGKGGTWRALQVAVKKL